MRCRTFFGPCSIGIYLWMAVLFKGSLQGEHQRRLYKELMANYNRLERPVINDSSPLLVELGMTLLQIIDVDEKNQVLMTNAWLQLYWTDVYLSWNPENYPGVQNLRFPSSQIWTPDILLYNSADERFDATFHTNVLVNASGYCQYIPPGILKSTCYIDVRWFPFDVQKCDLKFGSWTHNGWLLDLQMLDVDTSTYIPNGEWDLVGVPAKRNELYYDCCKEPYPDVTFTVTMRRRTLYYGLNLLIPCVLISGLALLVFLLPADSGEKISLGITVLLSLTVFMLLVAEIMPATSDSVPLIAQYFASTMMIVGLSVVVTVLVLQFHHHDPQGGKMPRWVRVVLLNWCAWFLRMKQPGEERKPAGYQYGHPPQQHSSASSIEMGPMGTVMGLTPPLSQAPCPTGTSNGSMSLYFSYNAVESPRCPTSSDSGVASGGLAQGTTCEEAEPPGGGAGRGRGGGGGGGGLIFTPPEVFQILEEVSYIAQRFRDQDEEVAICSEWKFAAAVVDRLCLVAFTLFSIIGTFTILMSAPNFLEAVTKDYLKK
uniref:neuronal acetylcholine receptor subunit alpha-7-like isoform X1 n=2 Tax=Oncorhynchus gorbuscha TaxID=8017 RepID=UPI001EAEBA19|nr:neuronal acetylcholine receptor subunit alpha-7-like isoform X1 [Oncorhynchus gorbuscha]XP_046180793.1 neuronal acetylcholine receptor subunit alpha-7-like isoform X1 [Oncorhynchus gorbuscha]XP_046180794.1 neuronal acetylcholine receptor subunit alpha-7-like isoform X1 [Oncorhynchus gorbuscha]